MNIKFKKYDNNFLYCDGVLTLEIDGVAWTFGSKKDCDFPRFWTSGGYYNIDTGNIVSAPWQINKYTKEEILESFEKIFTSPAYDFYDLLDKCLFVMNDNVDYGCCGECL